MTTSSPSTPKGELEAIAAARKKKRKKKKKKRSDNDIADVEAAPEDAAATAEAESSPVEATSVRPASPCDVVAHFDDIPSVSLCTTSRRIHNSHLDAVVDHLIAKVEPKDMSDLLAHQESLLEVLAKLQISQSTVQQAIEDISCRQCREYVARFVETHAKVSLGLKPQVSFDYIAMEEGMLPDGNSRIGLTFERFGSTDEKACWRLVDAMDVGGKNGLQTVLDLINDYVIACGLSDDERVAVIGHRAFNCSDGEVRAIHEMVNSRCRAWDTRRNELTKLLEKLVTAWKGCDEGLVAGEGDINTVAFPLIKNIDDALDDLICELQRELIRPLEDAYCATSTLFVTSDGLGQRYESELKRCLDELWIAFIECINRCIEVVADYEHDIFTLETRLGKLPGPFSSATLRKKLRDSVREKIVATQRLIDGVDKICQSEVDAGSLDVMSHTKTTLRRKLFTRHIFYETLQRRQEQTAPVFSEHIDDAWNTFVADLLQCAKFAHGASSECILKEHNKRREKLRSSLLVAFSTFEEACSSSQDDWSLQNCMGEDDDDKPQRSFVLDFSESMLPTRPLNSFRTKFRRCAVMSVKVGIELRTHCRSLPDDIEIPLQMPSSLTKTMSNNGEDALAPCYPGKEDHRAACILVGLFFRQLSVLCDEWRAHVAGLELLTSITSDVADEAVPSEVTKTKKKLKKKSKKAPSPDIQTHTSHVDNDNTALANSGSIFTASPLTSYNGSLNGHAVLSESSNGVLRDYESEAPIDEASQNLTTDSDVNFESEKTISPGVISSVLLVTPGDAATPRNGNAGSKPTESTESCNGDMSLISGTEKSRHEAHTQGKLADSSIPSGKTKRRRDKVRNGGTSSRIISDVDSVICVYDENGKVETAQSFLISRLLIALPEAHMNNTP